MPRAIPLPKKYMNCIEEAQDHLRLMAQRARLGLNELEAEKASIAQIQAVLRDIETNAYRIAFELSELGIAASCDNCPAAPSRTSAQILLIVLAEELEQQATLARQRAKNQ